MGVMPADSDITVPRGCWRRRLLRWLLAATCILALLCGGAGWWWAARPDIGDAVREAGGRYRRQSMSTPAGIFSDLVNQRPTTVFHWIAFDAGDVDDAWLHAHRDEIARLPYLILLLRDTRVTGEGLSALRGMQSIRFLNLTGTQLEDDDLAHVTTLPNLAQLYVSRTGISGEALTELSVMPHLTVIGIDSTQATPEGIAALATCPRLDTVLLLDADDASVAQVSRLSGLYGLMLVGEDVTAASITALKQMQGLRVLSLYDSHLTDEELQELRRALPGCTVQQLPYETIEQIEESQWD